MKKPYLIQRGSFRKEPDLSKKGIDQIISLDYMGSSEFEWGALPNSLKRIRNNVKDYVYVICNIKGVEIVAFTPKDDEPTIIEYLKSLAEDRPHLKEWSGFDKFINKDGFLQDKFQFWWDIENDIMWWKNDKNFTNQFKQLI